MVSLFAVAYMVLEQENNMNTVQASSSSHLHQGQL